MEVDDSYKDGGVRGGGLTEAKVRHFASGQIFTVNNQERQKTEKEVKT